MSIVRNLALAAIASVSLAACTDGYGYSGVSMGYGAGGYGGYGGYGDGFYDSGFYGGGFGPSYFGWYGDYYYPGTGYFVYDQYRRPHRWNTAQRNYWQGRARNWQGDRRDIRQNWGGYDRRPDAGAYRQDRRQDYRQGPGTREQFRTDRRVYNREARPEGRQLRREGGRRDRRN